MSKVLVLVLDVMGNCPVSELAKLPLLFKSRNKSKPSSGFAPKVSFADNFLILRANWSKELERVFVRGDVLDIHNSETSKKIAQGAICEKRIEVQNGKCPEVEIVARATRQSWADYNFIPNTWNLVSVSAFQSISIPPMSGQLIILDEDYPDRSEFRVKIDLNTNLILDAGERIHILGMSSKIYRGELVVEGYEVL